MEKFLEAGRRQPFVFPSRLRPCSSSFALNPAADRKSSSALDRQTAVPLGVSGGDGAQRGPVSDASPGHRLRTHVEKEQPSLLGAFSPQQQNACTRHSGRQAGIPGGVRDAEGRETPPAARSACRLICQGTGGVSVTRVPGAAATLPDSVQRCPVPRCLQSLVPAEAKQTSLPRALGRATMARDTVTPAAASVSFSVVQSLLCPSSEESDPLSTADPKAQSSDPSIPAH